MTTSAAPALAVVPQAGDILFIEDGQLKNFDVDTGIVTIVSCWNPSVCAPLIGSGPSIGNGGNASVGPDGFLYLGGISATGGLEPFSRVNLTTGDRETLEIGIDYAWAVYPSPNFFLPATVASLGGWGLAVLVAGIFIGVQLRVRGRAEA